MLETLLKHYTKTEFLENSFLRLPYAEPGGCLDVVKSSGWDILAAVLADPAGDVMVV